MLKAVLSKTEYEALPESVRALYKAGADGTLVVEISGDIPGYVPKTQLDVVNTKLGEFRDNNIALLRDKDALTTKVSELSTEITTLKTAKPEDKKPTGPDDLEAFLKPHLEPLKTQINTLITARDSEARRADEADLEKALLEVVPQVGVETTAVPDFLRRGKEVFKRENGRLVAKTADGSIMYSPDNAAQPLTVREWAVGLQKEAPHVFKPNTGGGGNGGGTSHEGKLVLTNPSPQEMGKHARDIAAGKVIVKRTA